LEFETLFGGIFRRELNLNRTSMSYIDELLLYAIQTYGLSASQYTWISEFFFTNGTCKQIFYVFFLKECHFVKNIAIKKKQEQKYYFKNEIYFIL
jgi:hypothetical protein